MIRHTFSNTEKLAYLNAELCLMKKPATLGLPAAKTRFDELQAVHALQAYATHFVVSTTRMLSTPPIRWTLTTANKGAFLPFHRALMHAHETALRTECGYQGWQP